MTSITILRIPNARNARLDVLNAITKTVVSLALIAILPTKCSPWSQVPNSIVHCLAQSVNIAIPQITYALLVQSDVHHVLVASVNANRARMLHLIICYLRFHHPCSHNEHRSIKRY